MKNTHTVLSVALTNLPIAAASRVGLMDFLCTVDWRETNLVYRFMAIDITFGGGAGWSSGSYIKVVQRTSRSVTTAAVAS